ncbi:NADH dehydrogenase [ubiquinone] 1 alpha subcomplex assembly factor 8 isoform X1 [Tachysurus vachellii]|uniref:NADH dehydrogenase [ubiquinone] 1 alpha subcomplex assembly factor 8 isoform X1 n=1 Tax=Tachysurus vachellii TaxID=175792 RepID=UPI00296AA883|nr:NADH dehydrogenase [ubiquinone] 1 alpha subcomplex assembly factor 8 isoform X1 [Tachysurus vachellii]
MSGRNVWSSSRQRMRRFPELFARCSEEAAAYGKSAYQVEEEYSLYALLDNYLRLRHSFTYLQEVLYPGQGHGGF